MGEDQWLGRMVKVQLSPGGGGEFTGGAQSAVVPTGGRQTPLEQDQQRSLFKGSSVGLCDGREGRGMGRGMEARGVR